jgi:hypothetical protein
MIGVAGSSPATTTELKPTMVLARYFFKLIFC